MAVFGRRTFRCDGHGYHSGLMDLRYAFGSAWPGRFVTSIYRSSPCPPSQTPFLPAELTRIVVSMPRVDTSHFRGLPQ
jgi:hypothetical protein